MAGHRHNHANGVNQEAQEQSRPQGVVNPAFKARLIRDAVVHEPGHATCTRWSSAAAG